MKTNRLILGIYLEPSVWVYGKGVDIDPKSISIEECLEIVFSKKLQNGIEVCVQRQGFIVVAFPESLLGIKISEIRTANLLPIKVAQLALSFFNAFLFLIYNQTYKHYNGGFQSIKQAIDISDIWRWPDYSSELKDIAIKQPLHIMKQDRMLSLDAESYLSFRTIGRLTENDRLFRGDLPAEILDQALDLLFTDNDIQVNWQLLALLNKAIFIIQRAEFEESLVVSWSVAEALIEIEWENYILQTNEKIGTSGEKTVNSKRLDKLVSTNYDASHRAEILELAKVIPYELYKRSLKARKTRNDWLHDLKPVSQEKCRNPWIVLHPR
jgi:hypothetical protein